MQSLITERQGTIVTCKHDHQREVGHAFDKDGRFLRLVRCLKCGLISREYLPALWSSPILNLCQLGQSKSGRMNLDCQNQPPSWFLDLSIATSALSFDISLIPPMRCFKTLITSQSWTCEAHVRCLNLWGSTDDYIRGIKRELFRNMNRMRIDLQ